MKWLIHTIVVEITRKRREDGANGLFLLAKNRIAAAGGSRRKERQRYFCLHIEQIIIRRHNTHRHVAHGAVGCWRQWRWQHCVVCLRRLAGHWLLRLQALAYRRWREEYSAWEASRWGTLMYHHKQWERWRCVVWEFYVCTSSHTAVALLDLVLLYLQKPQQSHYLTLSVNKLLHGPL